MRGNEGCRQPIRSGSRGRRGATRGRPSKLILGTIGSLVACSLLIAISPANSRAAVVDPGVRPSVVVIVTDDQRWDTLWAMPTVQSELVQKGTYFSNAFTSNALCCPSRTSILTGSYSHTTGIWRNQPPFGGFASFDDSSTIATWLQRDGYRTGLFGKYLNGYSGVAADGYVPPGWDRWVAFARSAYFDFELVVDGSSTVYGADPAGYSTDVLAAEATSFIRSEQGPLFVYFSPFGPHNPATPEPAYASEFAGLEPWRPPSYGEPDVTDKPRWVQRLGPFGARKAADKDSFHIDQYRSLRSVDDAVSEIIRALDETGRLADALIVFMSDNGLSWGEHRWGTKRVAYEESIRIPLVVRYDPAANPGLAEPNLAVGIDVAPTIADVTGAAAPAMDGASLLPLVESTPTAWRKDFLLEHMAKPEDRVPTYCGVRTTRYTYVYYETGEEELYDLLRDPYELDNLAGRRRMNLVLDKLRARLAQLCDPPPPGLLPPTKRPR